MHTYQRFIILIAILDNILVGGTIARVYGDANDGLAPHQHEHLQRNVVRYYGLSLHMCEDIGCVE